MSNVETDPAEVRCEPTDAEEAVQVLTARDVPLGGPRAMTVRRTLPQRARSLIGAWCFVDHYSPADVGVTGGMDVAPHPRTGLATVSWLFSGEIEHRDSHGIHAMVPPGGAQPDDRRARGVPLRGVDGPDDRPARCAALAGAPGRPPRHPARVRPPRPGRRRPPRGDARVFLGALAGISSPVETFTPLLGVELVLAPHAEATFDVDATFEHGLLIDRGPVELAGTSIGVGELGCVRPGRAELSLANPTDGPARALLLGGPPFGEEIVMWWNFVARDHAEIVAFREEWEAGGDRFGAVDGYVARPGGLDRLPAPALPPATLRPRGNPA